MPIKIVQVLSATPHGVEEGDSLGFDEEFHDEIMVAEKQRRYEASQTRAARRLGRPRSDDKRNSRASLYY